MRVESRIGGGDEPAIEQFLAATGFVPSDQQDAVASRVEGKGDAPDAAGGIEA